MRWLFLLLSGCASVDCNMKTDYAQMTPVPESGSVAFSWQYRSALQEGLYGLTRCNGDSCHLMMDGTPPDFSDICGLARLGHEVSHAMGARH